MKKTLLLAALFLALAVGAFYALRLRKAHTSATVSPEMDFAVKNTADIGKVFIADRKGQTATVERKDGFWLYNGKYKARPDAIENLLNTIRLINVQYVPTNAAEREMVKELAAQGLKVEIYDLKGAKIKSYYIGGVTADERGTIMIMEGSEHPFVIHIPSFVGQVRVRYMLGDENWRDRAVFSEKAEDIQSVSVEYPQQKSESFILEKVRAAEYTVRPFYSTTPASTRPIRKGVPESYLLQFESRIAEGFETTNPLRDSVMALVPFAIVSLKKTDGVEKKVKFWPVSVETEPETGKSFVVRYFTDYNSGDSFMLTQDIVMGPIFRGYSFFFEDPADKKRLRK